MILLLGFKIEVKWHAVEGGEGEPRLCCRSVFLEARPQVVKLDLEGAG